MAYIRAPCRLKAGARNRHAPEGGMVRPNAYSCCVMRIMPYFRLSQYYEPKRDAYLFHRSQLRFTEMLLFRMPPMRHLNVGKVRPDSNRYSATGILQVLVQCIRRSRRSAQRRQGEKSNLACTAANCSFRPALLGNQPG